MFRLRFQLQRLLRRVGVHELREAHSTRFSLCASHSKAAKHKNTKLTYPKLARSPRPLALKYLDDFGYESLAKTETSKDDLLKDDIEDLAMELETHLNLEDEEFDEEEEEEEEGGGVMDLFSGPDPSVPISKVPCSGCGALLHCRNPGVQGYVPANKFKTVSTSHLRLSGMVCQRCLLMNKYNIALNASVSPEQYKQIISSIHDVIALVVVIVDVMDMPNSLYAGLSQLIGQKRPVYIVGNKIDLLPPDEKDYLKRTKRMLMQASHDTGLASRNYVQHVGLVSAKTGYGIETLVTKLIKDWNRKGQVYLVGCTNAGKSTLFNALLSSDYCKSVARDFMFRSTVSHWPGTTLNLLKFPLMSPVPWRIKEREARLASERPSEKHKEILQRKLLRETGDPKHATLTASIGYTFISATEKVIDRKLGNSAEETSNMMSASYSFEGHSGRDSIEEGSSGLHKFRDSLKIQSHQILGRHAHDEKQYKRWCYDTPGLVNPNQIINQLTQEELTIVLYQSMLVPKSFVLKPKQVMLVGGLGRIEYVHGPQSIYFTVFTSPEIPVRVFDAVAADEFYHRHIGSSVLGVPLGDQDRLFRLPSLVGKEFESEGLGWRESCCDLVLSSLGWVAVTAGHEMPVTLRAFTPGGQGLAMRSPSLLKYAINLRGKRKSRRPSFEVKGIYMDYDRDARETKAMRR